MGAARQPSDQSPRHIDQRGIEPRGDARLLADLASTPSPSPAQASFTPGDWCVRVYAHDGETRAKMASVGMDDAANTQMLTSAGERCIVDANGELVAKVAPTTDVKRGKGSEHADAERDRRAFMLAASPSLYAYAKACELYDKTLDEMLYNNDSNARILRAELMWMGWDGTHGSFTEWADSLRTTALALAEGK